VYIHPGNPIIKPISYEGHASLWGPFWGWAVETASHALRLVLAGVFERHPDARIIFGHMGETLPFLIWRFDSRLPIAYIANGALSHPPSFYIKNNIAVTT
jgi:2,3-dihydroxybenzoate decarboxylase